jgi:hypothetical protein
MIFFKVITNSPVSFVWTFCMYLFCQVGYTLIFKLSG